ncbi:MaoC/PaaZ C-terminal domain-containing protein [Sphingomonas sp. C3-2]|uniref:MaoC/PaaZ C-terminal domain-containing protein n=1 Tax=Sphingomonas sp. C3-2 TaxID=3062169 RepID=UPI00294B1A3C|nr:MaoC/PaaZ C-terminal domain-containing protein [Sphingomonas sp. C3-2]WOK36207.1 MaoC/PaaZ C-terminal domain-containing protein [Sphingomonas sp. C3-2]
MKFNDITVGQALPELSFPITASAIVAGALATNDYENVHHDKAAAQARGVPDIFMNILTTNGLVQRFVTDWAGPSARIRNIAIRLGAPNFAGDTMVVNGTVESVDAAAQTAAIKVSGRNGLGEHVTSTVTIGFA